MDKETKKPNTKQCQRNKLVGLNPYYAHSLSHAALEAIAFTNGKRSHFCTRKLILINIKAYTQR